MVREDASEEIMSSPASMAKAPHLNGFFVTRARSLAAGISDAECLTH
jgi:hypothetical protein